MLAIDQSIDLDKDCDQFAWGMRQNQNDFHQFSWSPADFLFSTLKSWFYSCQQPANLADIHFQLILLILLIKPGVNLSMYMISQHLFTHVVI